MTHAQRTRLVQERIIHNLRQLRARRGEVFTEEDFNMHVIPRPILRRDPIEEGRQVVAQLSRQIADTRNLATVALAQFTHAARPSVTPKPPAAEQLLNVATAIAKKHRILLRDAIAVATHERPELAQQYRDRFVRP